MIMELRTAAARWVAPLGRRVTARCVGLLLAEAAEEPAEQAALAGKCRRGRWRRRPLGGYRCVVVGPGDGVHGLRLVEVLGAFDLGDEPDEVPVLHDLSLKPDRAVGIPFGLTAVMQVHPHSELVYPGVQHVGVDAAVAQRVDHPAGPVLFHRPKLAGPRDCKILFGLWCDTAVSAGRWRYLPGLVRCPCNQRATYHRFGRILMDTAGHLCKIRINTAPRQQRHHGGISAPPGDWGEHPTSRLEAVKDGS